LAPEPGGPEDQAPALEPTHPARRLAGNAVALLLDYAGQSQVVRAGRMNWVIR